MNTLGIGGAFEVLFLGVLAPHSDLDMMRGQRGDWVVVVVAGLPPRFPPPASQQYRHTDEILLTF